MRCLGSGKIWKILKIMKSRRKREIRKSGKVNKLNFVQFEVLRLLKFSKRACNAPIKLFEPEAKSLAREKSVKISQEEIHGKSSAQDRSYSKTLAPRG